MSNWSSTLSGAIGPSGEKPRFANQESHTTRRPARMRFPASLLRFLIREHESEARGGSATMSDSPGGSAAVSDTRAQTCGRECHSRSRRCRRKLEITFTLCGASPSRGHATTEPRRARQGGADLGSRTRNSPIHGIPGRPSTASRALRCCGDIGSLRPIRGGANGSHWCDAGALTPLEPILMLSEHGLGADAGNRPLLPDERQLRAEAIPPGNLD